MQFHPKTCLHLISTLESVLYEIGHQLRMKYGMGRNPDADQIRRWADWTNSYIRSGVDPEAAGGKAAELVFPDFGQFGYNSESQTIAMLLDTLKGKIKR